MAGAPAPGALAGEPDAVQSAFDEMPVILLSVAGPEHRIVAANAACRAYLPGTAALGRPVREVLPGAAAGYLGDLLDQACATGEQRRARQLPLGGRMAGPDREQVYADVT